MLPDVGGTEYLLIAAVALIVIGPKDLPKVMRKLGEAVGKMRAMAAEFRSSFDEMARQSELDDLRREVEAMRAERLDPMQAAVDAFNAETSPATAPAWPTPEIEAVTAEPKAKKPRAKASKSAKPAATSKAPPKSAARATKTSAKARSKANSA